MIRLVAFDLDDTLYLEREFVKSGFTAAAIYLEGLGLAEASLFFRTAWGLFEAGARRTIFNQTMELLQLDFSPERINELVSVYREHPPDIRPFDTSSQLLALLKERQICLALISDGLERTQSNKLRALGLADFFNQTIFTGAHGPDWCKPSPRPFLEVMKRGKTPAESCCYIADNPQKDFFAPNTLGWRTIRVREKIGLYYEETALPGGGPTETVDSFQGLGDLLLPWLD